MARLRALTPTEVTVKKNHKEVLQKFAKLDERLDYLHGLLSRILSDIEDLRN